MVQGDNKFEMLINMSTLCDDTWINITYTQHIFIHLGTYILNGREIKGRVCVHNGSRMSPRRLSQIRSGEGVEREHRDTHE